MFKTLLPTFICSIFAYAIFCAAKPQTTNETFPASIMGKEFSKSTEISDSIEDNQEGFVCRTNGNYCVKVFAHKADIQRWYLLLITKMQGNANKRKVADVIELDFRLFKKGSKLQWNCCKDQNGNDSQYIVIYVPNAQTKDGEKMVQPEKAWKPNTAIGKFDTISNAMLFCAPETISDEE